MRRFVALVGSLLIALLPSAVWAATPVDYTNKWIGSYETLLFDTPNGDIDSSQYALDENGTGYYARTTPQAYGQFQHFNLSFNVAGLKQVHIVPGKHAYYNEFLTATGANYLAKHPYEPLDRFPYGSVVRVASTEAAYKALGNTRNAQQPKRIESVLSVPPAIPKDSILGTEKRDKPHSIAFDAASNSGAKLSVSSFTWSHTVGVTGDILWIGISGYNLFTSSYPVVTGASFNSVNMTYARSDNVVDASPIAYTTDIRYLTSPTVGAHTVAVYFSSVVQFTGAGVSSYSGASSTGIPYASSGNSGLSGSPSVTVTSLVNNSWSFAVLSSGSPPGASGNNELWNIGGGTSGGSDTGHAATGTSETLSWTNGSSGWVMSAISFVPATLAPTIPIISTLPATSKTSTSAILQGSVDNLSGYSAVNAYFQYGLTMSYGEITTLHTLTTPVAYNDTLSGLMPNTLYHYRAVATYNGTGNVVYGSDIAFTTSTVTIPSNPNNLVPTVVAPTAVPDAGILVNIATDGLFYPFATIANNLMAVGLVFWYRIILFMLSLIGFILIYSYTRHLGLACLAPLIVLGYGMTKTAIPWIAWLAVLLLSIGLTVNEGRQP